MNTSNLIDLSYKIESSKLTKFPYPIVDIHTHMNGTKAVEIYQNAAKLYGIGFTVSMTQLEQIPVVKKLLGDRIGFIATPQFNASDPTLTHGEDYCRRLDLFREHGVTIAKFWCGPRIYELSSEPFVSNPFRLDSPLRLASMKYAVELGMNLMLHVADPDTWFKTKYADAVKYGTKDQQYHALEEVLARFNVPTLVAHFGGSPENLERLDGLLSKYPHLLIDTSATKWMVRELSKQPKELLLAFFEKFKTRILFGSDIVTSEQHLSKLAQETELSRKASNEAETFDLYASRYWALRTLFETSYREQSPISDPDLHMVNPSSFTPEDSPTLEGKSLPPQLLHMIYYENAIRFLNIGSIKC